MVVLFRSLGSSIKTTLLCRRRVFLANESRGNHPCSDGASVVMTTALALPTRDVIHDVSAAMDEKTSARRPDCRVTPTVAESLVRPELVNYSEHLRVPTVTTLDYNLPTTASPTPSSEMSGGSKSASFHRVKTFELPRLEVDRQFSDVRLLAEGWYAKVYAAKHHESDSQVVLKCVQKETTKKKDFFREFHYNYYLSPHPNIVNSFDVAFDTNTSYVFAQEMAPNGDLAQFVRKGGLGELKSKRVAEQIAFALEFVHSKDLVHRDVRLENIFVFDREISRVKLGDFGNMQRAGTLVKKVNVRVPWAPPEVCQAVYNEGYHVETSLDAWQLGILIFVSLTGSYPWYSADITDRHYNSWVAWLKRKTTKIPRRFKCFTPRLLRLLRRLLEPKPEKRAGVREVYKYLSDSWLVKGIDPLDIAFDESSSEIFVTSTKPLYECAEKKKLVDLLRSYGIQTTVDKKETTKRICEWLLTSASPCQRGM